MKKFGYRKSRHGCMLCKKRRVKCDEQRPCGACSKHGVSCSLMSSPDAETTPQSATHSHVLRSHRPSPYASTTFGSERSSPSPSPSSSPSVLFSSSTHTPAAPSFSGATFDVPFLHAPAPDPGLLSPAAPLDKGALLDLELMHHYTFSVCDDFPYVSMSSHFWKNSYFLREVPRLATRHPFLMHQVLAMSAFHLAHVSKPSLPPEYVERAIYHLNHALRGLREALSVEMTTENCTALFVASSFLLSSTYASRRYIGEDPAAGNPLDDIVGMVGLYHGISALQHTATRNLSKDILNEVFGRSQRPPEKDAPWLSHYTDELKKLDVKIEAFNDLDEKPRRVAREGVEALLEVAKSATDPVRGLLPSMDLRVLYRWPYVVHQEFIDAIHAREPASLAVFLFYSAAMRQAETECWFLIGWATRLSKAACHELENTPWLGMAQWAFDIIDQPHQETTSSTPALAL